MKTKKFKAIRQEVDALVQPLREKYGIEISMILSEPNKNNLIPLETIKECVHKVYFRLFPGSPPIEDRTYMKYNHVAFRSLFYYIAKEKGYILTPCANYLGHTLDGAWKNHKKIKEMLDEGVINPTKWYNQIIKELNTITGDEE